MTALRPDEALAAAALAADEAANLLAADAAAVAIADGPVHLLGILRTVETARSALQLAEGLLKARLAAHMAADAERARQRLLELPGVATVERRPGGRRKDWDSALLLPAVVRSSLEAYENADEFGALSAGAEIATGALNAAARLEWRSTSLKALGLDPDRYCTIERGPDTLTVRWADLEPEQPASGGGEVAA